MFTIIGGDGKEYGPVSAEQVSTWLNSGRANLQTKARRAGGDDWRALGEFPEFNPAAAAEASGPPLLAASPGSAAPAASAGGAATPAPAVDREATLPSRGARLGAALTDTLIGFLSLAPGSAVLGVAFVKLAMSGDYGGAQSLYESMPVGRLLLGLSLFFFLPVIVGIGQIWLLGAQGQTLGKKFFSIRIVRHPGRAPAGFLHAWLLRSVVPGFLMLVPTLGWIFFLVDSGFIFRADRRCLHDLIAGTSAVRA